MFPGRTVEMLAFGSPQSNVDAGANNEWVSDQFATGESVGLALNRPDWEPERLLRELRRPAIIGVKPYERLIRDFEGGDVSIFGLMPTTSLRCSMNSARG